MGLRLEHHKRGAGCPMWNLFSHSNRLSSLQMCSHSQDVTPSYFKTVVEALSTAPLLSNTWKGKADKGEDCMNPPPNWTTFLESSCCSYSSQMSDARGHSGGLFPPSNPIIYVLCSTPPSRIHSVSVYQRGLIFPECRITACPS